jgi:plasmid stability protein
VQALKKRAGAHGRSQEAELRAILSAELLSPPRRKLAELLASMPDFGLNADVQRRTRKRELLMLLIDTNVISEARKGRRPRRHPALSGRDHHR